MRIGDTYTSMNNNAGKSTDAAAQLGKDAFLKLLVEQLRNQNPLQPMESTAFLSQLAQFRNLEQLQDLQESMIVMVRMLAADQACSLLGKKVEGSSAEGGSLSGVVQALRFESERIVVCLEEGEIYLDDVTRVYAA